ncbi:uncharacterized protein LOC134253704 [Saccostrea cucullata]|uniref:uncharacterized protein LOC134253704 n=1 Tax=Saccostrea cuccullata TaxID=36930 RepID=UPI002ED1AF05
MDRKRYSVKRQSYEEAQKPVYVLSEQYENISSDEEFTTENDRDEQPKQQSELDFLEDISLDSGDIPSDDFVRDLLDAENLTRPEEEDIDDEGRSETPESRVEYETLSEREESDNEHNNVTQVKSTICLILNKVTTTFPDGKIEVSRDSQILYSEDIDPENVDFNSVASEVFEEVKEHCREGKTRVIRGDFSM